MNTHTSLATRCGMASSSLLHAPNEILSSIAADLSNADVKSLRLTCRCLGDRVALRLDRVFISANPLNLRVARAVADHDRLRHGVVQVIWDDARLVKGLDPGDTEKSQGSCPNGEEPYPAWFGKACNGSTRDINQRLRRFGHEVHAPYRRQLRAQMTLAESWAYYRELLEQQDQVLASGADTAALEHALRRFPRLRRVTITPAAHGFLYLPRYPTPMIRSLPPGFTYPIPRGWPTAEDGQPDPEVAPWDAADERTKDQWRGFRVVTRTLAEMGSEHSVSELVIKTHQLNTGLNYTIFQTPCREYDDLVTLISKKGFRRLDMTLLVPPQGHQASPLLSQGRMRQALAQATDLEHVSVYTNIQSPATSSEFRGALDHFAPLGRLFPVEAWPRLRHFGLAGFHVAQDDVVSFLSELPPTVRSVELSFLQFLEGRYGSLLSAMRDALGWRGRDDWERPEPVIRLCPPYARAGKAICISRGAGEFLYGDRRRLFLPNGNQVPRRNGHVERDEFDPAYDRPY